MSIPRSFYNFFIFLTSLQIVYSTETVKSPSSQCLYANTTQSTVSKASLGLIDGWLILLAIYQEQIKFRNVFKRWKILLPLFFSIVTNSLTTGNKIRKQKKGLQWVPTFHPIQSVLPSCYHQHPIITIPTCSYRFLNFIHIFFRLITFSWVSSSSRVFTIKSC